MNGMLHLISCALQISSTVATLVSDILDALLIDESWAVPLWIFTYILMAVINLHTRSFFVFVKVLTLYVCLVLLCWIIWGFTRMNVSADYSWYNKSLVDDQVTIIGLDFLKIVDSFPYAIWWFLAMEARSLNPTVAFTYYSDKEACLTLAFLGIPSNRRRNKNGKICPSYSG
jgi:energy-coupling factor transporter transmembrane protein EcfT